MRLGKKHRLTATDAYELEGFIMDRFTNGLAIFGERMRCRDAVKQTICDTLQNLPEHQREKLKTARGNIWRWQLVLLF